MIWNASRKKMVCRDYRPRAERLLAISFRPGSDATAAGCLGCETPGISHNAKELEVHFEIYTDKAGEFRFRITATNGNVLASSEGYKQKASAVNAIERIKSDAVGAATIDNS
jgi:uncharacterized protein